MDYHIDLTSKSFAKLGLLLASHCISINKL